MPSLTGRELVLTRTLKAPRANVYRAWTEPDLLTHGSPQSPTNPPPPTWASVPAALALSSCAARTAPSSQTTASTSKSSPTSASSSPTPTPEPGNPRQALHDRYHHLEDDGPHTRYTARVLHWTTEDRDQHEKMGFHQGWGQCADQLEAVAASLKKFYPSKTHAV